MKKLIYYIYLPIGIFYFLLSLPLVIILFPIFKLLIKITHDEDNTITLKEFIPYWFYLYNDYNHIIESINLLFDFFKINNKTK